MTATLTQKQLARPQIQPTIIDGPLWKLSVARYHDMIEAGLLTSDDKCELLNGILVHKMPKYPLHCTIIRVLEALLREILPDDWLTITQDPITLAESEPEPDLVVVRGSRLDYDKRHPYPEDIGLLAEVAESSLPRDLGSKLRIYAAEGIVEYWVVDVDAQEVEVCNQPTGAGDSAEYASRLRYGVGEEIAVKLDGVEVGRIAVNQLFDL